MMEPTAAPPAGHGGGLARAGTIIGGPRVTEREGVGDKVHPGGTPYRFTISLLAEWRISETDG